ncbi:FecR family protein [Dawidia soli]|uniref:FecR domain-containing protein n=1 Tax=Dawidia soli TaxID=2782352 RepID=A0AAP2GHQ9_9BACT|nr:FecR domain-containing protein [Dawidia soli]MBT1686258.1 FecR domain-containing protein [Dawidia soli]
MKTTIHDLVHRFLNNTATVGEREHVMRLLVEGRLGKLLGEQVYQHQLFYLNNPRLLAVPHDERQRSAHVKRRTLETIVGVTANPAYPWQSSPWVAAAAMLVVLVLAVIWVAQQSHAEVQQMAKRPAVEREAVYQGRQFFHLTDNTAVTLNHGSELRYSSAPGAFMREVTLKGEAYFDVAHDPTRPFIIHANGVTVKVLGTAFNVRAYTGQPEVRVTVVRGLVDVRKPGNFQTLLHPDQELAVDVASGHFARQSVDAAEAIGWNRGFIILDSVDLQTAAAILEKRFGRKITVEGSDIGTCHIAAVFVEDDVTLTRVLDAITQSLPDTHYTISPGGDVVLHTTACR